VISNLIQLAIKLNEEAYERLKQVSENAGIDVDTACRLILEAFAGEPPERTGGKIVAGRSINGKLIIAWPRFFQLIEPESIKKEM
jgi:hypothetical protein